MRPENVPEIQRTNLANVILMLKSLNIKNVQDFDFLDPPPLETIMQASLQLWTLGALNGKGQLTSQGGKMSEFPLDPHLSKVLMESVGLGCVRECVVIVSMLNVPNIFHRPKEKEAEADRWKQNLTIPESDHLTLLNVYQKWKENEYREEWCKKRFLNWKSLNKVRSIKKQIEEILREQKIEITSNENKSAIKKALCAGYFANAVRMKRLGEYFNLRNGMTCYLHPSSALYMLGHAPEYLIYHEVILTHKEYLHTASEVEPQWLAEYGPMYFEMKALGQGEREEGCEEEEVEEMVEEDPVSELVRRKKISKPRVNNFDQEEYN